MEAPKRKKLEAAGWRVGSADEFLELTPEESALVDLKLALGKLVRRTRVRSHLSQSALAARLGSSQSRVAKLEAGDARVSLDLIFKAAFVAGANQGELAKAVGMKRRNN